MSLKVFAASLAVPERSSYQYVVTLTTPTNTPVAPAQIDAISLSLRDIRTNAIINGRSAIAVKNANGGTLTTGLFTMQFVPDDMPAIGTSDLQPRKMTLDFQLAGGGRVTREVQFWVRALQDIT